MAPYRVQSKLPALADNWIDISEVWTQAEIRNWLSGNTEKLLPILERKAVGVHVYRPDGSVIEDAHTLIAEINDIDVRMVKAIGPSVVEILIELMALGEANRQLLSDGVEVAPRK